MLTSFILEIIYFFYCITFCSWVNFLGSTPYNFGGSIYYFLGFGLDS